MLQRDQAGKIILPLAFINKVIEILAALDDFMEELSKLSEYVVLITPTSAASNIPAANRQITMTDPILETLKNTLDKLRTEQRGVWDDLAARWPEAEEVVDLARAWRTPDDHEEEGNVSDHDSEEERDDEDFWR